MSLVRVVDDTVDVANLLTLMLRHNGFDVVETTGDFADLLGPELWAGIDVAVVDLMMPVSGAQIVAYLKQHHPSIRRVVWTAWADMADSPDLVALADAVITKPTSVRQMIEAVRG